MQPGVKREYHRWGQPRRLSREAFFALDRIDDGLIVIDYGAVELPLFIVNRQAPATFYGFHAAMNPVNRRPLPFFQGRKIAPSRLNSVLLCDPSLYLHESVKVGWFLGNRHCDLATELPPILDHLDRLMGATRRLLWGNSAGGTAALRYSRDQDVTIAINPQTILEHFTWGRVLPWLEHGWGTLNGNARPLAREIGDLRIKPPVGRIVYVQNVEDDHRERHFRPLAESAGFRTQPGDDGHQRLVLGAWGRGHIPPPAALQRRLINEEADRLLDELGVKPGIWDRMKRMAATF